MSGRSMYNRRLLVIEIKSQVDVMKVQKDMRRINSTTYKVGVSSFLKI
jgi:hypothetical protein